MSVAQTLGFNDDRRSDIGIVATELATNTLLHARTGELLICPFQDADGGGLDLLALDQGCGIPDIPRALEDGFSTMGTAGQGFGAMRRLSTEVSIYSAPERGTVVWSRFAMKPVRDKTPIGVVSLPATGESVCGDAYVAVPGQRRSVYMVVDGLGHGIGAQEASQEAVTVTNHYVDLSPAEILSLAHDALKKTRGAAMSIAVVDYHRLEITYGGIGNISASITTGSTTRSLVSQNGTVGAVLPRLQEYVYPYELNSTLLMFSDGLTSKCSIGQYPGLQNRHPQLIAGLLYRDFSRRRDDVTVLLARLGEDCL